MKDENKNSKKFDIKEFLQDKQKRSILILALYFIFFIFLTVSIRTGHGNGKPVERESLSDLINKSQAVEKVQLNSFEYEYKIMKDSSLYTYTGKHYYAKEQFQFDNNTYFKDSDKYYKKLTEENGWEETVNPYVYSEYLNFDKINEILSKSEYESTTNYKDNTTSISYKMYIDSALTDNIMTITSKDNVLQKIEINIDKDSIVMSFSKQDSVEEFNKE